MSSVTHAKPTDWRLCALCQENSDIPLIDPSNARNIAQKNGYIILSENLQTLRDLDAVPLSINISRLDDGSGIEITLKNNNAKWHKTCYMLCTSKTQIDRARKRKMKIDIAVEHNTPVKNRLRSSSTLTPMDIDDSDAGDFETCFFCDQSIQQGEIFHHAETMNMDIKVRLMANEVKDSKLLTKLACFDLPAVDAVYHKSCITELYNKYRKTVQTKESVCSSKINPESVALAELISYIEDVHQSDENPTNIFTLSHLMSLFKSRLGQLADSSTSDYVHASRLKQKLIEKIPGLEAYKTKSNEIVLSFNNDIADALLNLSNRNSDNDAVVLMRAAQIVRRDIFQTKYSFNGSLVNEDYNSVMSSSLATMVQLILGGTNIKHQTEVANDVNSAVNSITQLLTYNAVKRGRKESTTARHNAERETPLPLYLGLLIHNKTRRRGLVDVMFKNGLSVSYDRVLQVSTDEANKVVTLFEHEGVVCPTSLKQGLYTTGNLDNIDHNPSSTSAQDSFHGTAISLTQHVTDDNPGTPRIIEIPLEEIDTTVCKRTTIQPLPDAYTYVPPAQFPNDKPSPSVPSEDSVIPDMTLINADETQYDWLKNVHEHVKKDMLDENDNVSWSAYFASQQDSNSHNPAITCLMPLFRDTSHSLAMIKHGMDLIEKATNHVNPGQVPVLTVDQPLYAIAKKVQWSWPAIYGEKRFVVLLGGLHIEMALLNLLGDWLDGSGWTSVLVKANVTTEGRAQNLLKGSDTSRAQWAHQVMAASLFILMKQAYLDHKDSTSVDNVLPFPEWCTQMEDAHPQFCYWSKTLRLELLLLQFLKSQRERDFAMYVQALRKIIPLMFALDHYNYSRWLTIHVQDLAQLHAQSPSTFSEFCSGHFVTQKTCHNFSAIAHDHVHEQLNAMVKGEGGAIGVTEDAGTLRRWMVAGPEISRILNEYKDKHKSHKINNRHHEQIPSIQKTFVSDVRNVVNVIDGMGNPFLEDSTELFTLDTKVIMSDQVIQSVRTVEDVGNAQYEQFVDGRLRDIKHSFYDIISKNKLPLFTSGRKTSAKTKTKMASMKTDLQLFSRMYISCQARDGDMDTFFEHENHAWPPSLAEYNVMHHGNKADLLGILESYATRPVETPQADVKILDGAALVHTLNPNRANVTVKSFSEYAQHVFLPCIRRELKTVTRLDVVWDVYKSNSLKSQLRQSRGDGEALRVAANTLMPSNWNNFLRVDTNKSGLFSFLASSITSADAPHGKVILTTDGESVVATSPLDLSQIQPCTHEEADYRIMLHVFHAYQQGHRKMIIQATDTDVLVLAIVTASVLSESEIWLAFGHGAKFRYIAAHTIASKLGADCSSCLPFLHAVSGCDTISYFRGVGKKTAWDVWYSSKHLWPVFRCLSHVPSQVSQNNLEELERYVVLLYNRTSSLSGVNDARKDMFSHGNRKIENIPPTSAALHQHIKRAAYQAGHIWGQALVANPTLPSPEDWGWTRDGNSWSPVWSTLPEAAKACRELIKCQCKKKCSGRCNCTKAGLRCTHLCFCAGQCNAE